jgi:cell pole-organizing protein PopZ
VRTLEDTVVDLLRPMVRDWLDDNMPRLVEKALRIEATDRARAQDDTKH